jgi:hypothetical protein
MTNDNMRIRAALADIEHDLGRQLTSDAFVIGSAAVCLVGADIDVADLDILTTTDDARRLEQVWQSRRVHDYLPSDGGLFRSRFARYAFTAMPVEIMGGLEVCMADAWHPVHIDESRLLEGYAARLRLPAPAELRRVLLLFGRDKDRRRAAFLRDM